MKKGARQNTIMCTCVPKTVHQAQIEITGCCIFLLNTFPAEKFALIVSLYCILISQKEKKNTRCTLLPSLCFDILMKPNTTENYKISQINTALDHKHDTDDPSTHSPFLK